MWRRPRLNKTKKDGVIQPRRRGFNPCARHVGGGRDPQAAPKPRGRQAPPASRMRREPAGGAARRSHIVLAVRLHHEPLPLILALRTCPRGHPSRSTSALGTCKYHLRHSRPPARRLSLSRSLAPPLPRDCRRAGARSAQGEPRRSRRQADSRPAVDEQVGRAQGEPRRSRLPGCPAAGWP